MPKLSTKSSVAKGNVYYMHYILAEAQKQQSWVKKGIHALPH